MTASIPDLDSELHFASVDYAASFGGLTTGQGLVSFSTNAPVQFSFAFETGSAQPVPGIDLQVVSWDYDWFDQAAVETAIAAALDSICLSLSRLLSLPLADVQESVTVQRIWTVAANQQGSAAPQQYGSTGMGGIFTVIEPMTYPVEITDTETSLADDGGEQVQAD